MMLLGYAYYKRGSIDRKQFVQRNIKTEFSKFVKYKDAMNEYFMSKMNVRRRQVVIDIDKDHSAVIQAGAMQFFMVAVYYEK